MPTNLVNSFQEGAGSFVRLAVDSLDSAALGVPLRGHSIFGI